MSWLRECIAIDVVALVAAWVCIWVRREFWRQKWTASLFWGVVGFGLGAIVMLVTYPGIGGSFDWLLCVTASSGFAACQLLEGRGRAILVVLTAMVILSPFAPFICVSFYDFLRDGLPRTIFPRTSNWAYMGLPT